MSAMVETMAYANEVPWHGLGNPVTDKMTPEQMRKAASLDWKVEKRPIFQMVKNKPVEIPGQFALTRVTDDTMLSLVGATYKPVQNEVALDFFTKWVKAGHMKMETAGSLWGGRYIWALARVGKDFVIGGAKSNDEVRSYLLLSSPHVLGKSMTIQFTPIRVVCWNTLTMALGAGLKGSAGAFRMPHSMAFDDKVKEQAEVALGIATQQTELLQSQFAALSKKKAKLEEVDQFFFQVLRYDPKKAKAEDKREPRALAQFRAALTHAPGATLPTAEGTMWGALNAVTFVVDHDQGKERSTALRNAWFGNKAQLKRRALEIALDMSK